MQIQTHYQGLENSPWMDKFITNKVSKLNRYLNQSATLHVYLRCESRKYLTTITIHNLNRDYVFSSNGENLYESFSIAIEKANRTLTEHKRKLKDKINKRYVPLKQAIAS